MVFNISILSFFSLASFFRKENPATIVKLDRKRYI